MGEVPQMSFGDFPSEIEAPRARCPRPTGERRPACEARLRPFQAAFAPVNQPSRIDVVGNPSAGLEERGEPVAHEVLCLCRDAVRRCVCEPPEIVELPLSDAVEV